MKNMSSRQVIISNPVHRKAEKETGIYNVLANSKAILDIVSAAPVPILGPVLSAATKVLAEVESARALKESCIILATRATSIVGSIYLAVVNQAPVSAISELNITYLSETLLDIAKLMHQLSQFSWFMFLLKRFYIHPRNASYFFYTSKSQPTVAGWPGQRAGNETNKFE
ncbi:hypothetical protein BDN71DRAFT_422512 [Pleurotus eryngii]|uniref:Uncharacterized protein n=1 Tax=Pleurotus eryngii TaxID=5323 RepID=A0A9P6A328_PLEER|nr:hypothetical protein BDN71DRAFT_422512 [Pleurotus eryngii]